MARSKPRARPCGGQAQRPRPPMASASAATSGMSGVTWRDERAKSGIVPNASTARMAALRRNRPTPAQYTAINAPIPDKAPNRRAPSSLAPTTRMPSACSAAFRSPWAAASISVASDRSPCATRRARSATFNSQGSHRPNPPNPGKHNRTENNRAQAQPGTRRSLSMGSGTLTRLWPGGEIEGCRDCCERNVRHERGLGFGPGESGAR